MSRNRKCLYKRPDGTPCPNDALPGEPYCAQHRFVEPPSTGYTGGGQAQADPPIVISGGSVVIEFDTNLFQPVGQGKHANPNKKIRRVEIVVDGGTPQTIDVPNGKVIVQIHYGDP